VRHPPGRNRVQPQLQKGDGNAGPVSGSRVSWRHCGMVHRGAFPSGRRWYRARGSDPAYADRRCADEQAVARPCLGRRFRPRRATSPSLGQAARPTNDHERRCLRAVLDLIEPRQRPEKRCCGWCSLKRQRHGAGVVRPGQRRCGTTGLTNGRASGMAHARWKHRRSSP